MMIAEAVDIPPEAPQLWVAAAAAAAVVSRRTLTVWAAVVMVADLQSYYLQ